MKMTPKFAKLRLVVFDLDYTIWQPEMYQLNGSPRLMPNKKCISGKVLQEAQTNVMGHILVDGDHEPIRVFEGASHALQEINRLRQEGHDISAAVASRTDEPKWAHICLKHLQLSDGTTLHECFEDRIVIDCMHDKQYHLKRLQGMTGIKYDEMCFFDNEHWNIKCVEKLGVPSFFTPQGMTRSAWTAALKYFNMQDY